jgi:hypothetical protein
MKIYMLLFTIFLLKPPFSIGQQNPPLRKLTYKISITDPGMRQIKGYLFNTTDTSVKISRLPGTFAFDASTKENFKEVPYHQISEIKIKNRHGAARGALIGTLTGLLIGIVAGSIEGDDPEENWFRLSATDKALRYGGIGAAGGIGIGAIIGNLLRKKFIIGGNREKFHSMKQNVMNKAYGSQSKSLK